MAVDMSVSDAEATPPPLFDPASIASPFARLARLRAKGALVLTSFPEALGGGTAWMVTRMEEAVQVLKDKRFTVDLRAFDPSELDRVSRVERERGPSMLTVDGLDHTRLRGLVARVFTPRYIQDLRPAIQQLADELLDRVQAQGSMDVVHDFAYPLPINVISDMLGVPQQHREQMRVWSEAFAETGMDDPAERAARIDEFLAYVRGLLAEKRQQPADDLISQLIAFEASGDELSEGELISTVALLIFGGHETTSNLISIGLLTLLEHPAQLAQLQANPALVPQAVEELLRYSGPLSFTSTRFATEDVELAGKRIRRGERVLVSLISVNHDPEVFANPEEFAIAREISRQFAFGHGVHMCLGAPLARLEGEIAFTMLLRRMPNLRLALPAEQIAWRGAGNLRGLRALPVTF